MHFGRAPTHAAVLLGLGLTNLAVLLALGLHGAHTLTLAGLAFLFCLIFFLAVRLWLLTPGGTLGWDGSAWRWSVWSQDEVCQVHWAVALPGFSVLRLSAGNGDVQWLLTGPAWEQGPQWIALRRALIAHGAQAEGLVLGRIRV
ncbi:MAG: hypothetical protein JHD06_02005 [Rhodoferax sp.]|jgi:hypothetical protein|nr:hypothetical protein [Rhodoferax sp.]